MLRTINQLHDDMQVRVAVAGDVFEPFSVSRGVKEGCTLAPVLFNTYVQCITRLFSAIQSQRSQININFRTDRNLFNVSKLKAKSKVRKISVSELQYADDCALLAPSVTDHRRNGRTLSKNGFTDQYEKD